MRLRDPIELYEYPEAWISRMSSKESLSSVRRKIESGLFILTPKGWLRRGITTGTTATAAILGAVLWKERVEVQTPAGIPIVLNVHLHARNAEMKEYEKADWKEKRESTGSATAETANSVSEGAEGAAAGGAAGAKGEERIAEAVKFAGDHAFDVTDGLKVVARVVRRRQCEAPVVFGEGIGVMRNKKKAVSDAVLHQIHENLKRVNADLCECCVVIEVPEGKEVAKRTGNERVGISGGISLLGTTGFVEPWCDELLRTKIEIAKRCNKVAITTGRSGWRFCIKNIPEFQPFVFGVHVEEALNALKDQEIVIVGAPSLLLKWASPQKWMKMRPKVGERKIVEEISKIVMKKARSVNRNVSNVIII